MSKIGPTGSALVYSTYLGGSGFEEGNAIALDASGAAYLSGLTNSTDFPTQSLFQVANGGPVDIFASKLNPAGSGLVYSTYLGGSLTDQGSGIAVDSAGAVHLTGVTSSTDFPTSSPFQASSGGAYDAFVTKVGGPPTTVALRSFSAESRGGGTLLRWRTGSEVGPAGFVVYREKAGRTVRLNRALIPSRGVGGQAYSWLDSAVGPAPRYRLQAVGLDGRRSWIGSARVAGGKPRVSGSIVRYCGPATARLSVFPGITFRGGSCSFKTLRGLTTMNLLVGVATRDLATNKGQPLLALNIVGPLSHPVSYAHGRRWAGVGVSFKGNASGGTFVSRGVGASHGTATRSFRCHSASGQHRPKKEMR